MNEARVESEILELAQTLIRIPSVTVGKQVRFDEVNKASDLVEEFLASSGLEVRRFNNGDFPAILASFPGRADASVMLSGHFDVVDPEPDDSQFIPRIEEDYLWGRGSADMKTVVATYMVWMAEIIKSGTGPFPNINLLLVGNEEMGEVDPMGTGHVLAVLNEEGYQPDIVIAGERTEESGLETWGQICIQNRGVVRFSVSAQGARGHTGMAASSADLTRKIIRARRYLSAMAERYLSLKRKKSWRSQIRFPFIQVGVPGVYNITPDSGLLGVEIRPIPGDRIEEMMEEFENYAFSDGLVIRDRVIEPGSSCDPQNPFLEQLVRAVEAESGRKPVLGRKLAGTSARFAPQGNGVVWGQSGIGPHSAEERHFIPSILPYFRALNTFGKMTTTTMMVDSS